MALDQLVGVTGFVLGRSNRLESPSCTVPGEYIWSAKILSFLSY